MEIRQLQDDDIPAGVALWNTAMQTEREHDRDQLTTEDLNSFREGEHYFPEGVVVAEDEGELCGIAAGYIEHGQENEAETTPARLAGIAVEPDRWREGIGQRLLAHVEEALHAAGQSELRIYLFRQSVRLGSRMESGPYIDTGPYRFFVSCGYQPYRHSMGLRNDLREFEMPTKIKQRRNKLESEGITFKRLEAPERQSLLELVDEYFSTGWYNKFERVTSEDALPVIPIVKTEGNVIGFMGPCRVTGERGSIGTPGIDPAYRGRGIGKTRFFFGLQYLKEAGAAFTEYRTGYEELGADAANEMYFDSGARLVNIACKDFRKQLS